MSLPHLPLMLPSYITLVQLSESKKINVGTILLTKDPSWFLPVLFMSFSYSRLLTGSHTACGYFLSLTQSVKAPLTLSFMTLTFLKRTDQLFCQMSCNLGLSDIFLTMRLNITGNIVSSVHWIRFLMLLCLVTGDVDLYHLIRGSRGFC